MHDMKSKYFGALPFLHLQKSIGETVSIHLPGSKRYSKLDEDVDVSNEGTVMHNELKNGSLKITNSFIYFFPLTKYLFVT